MRIYQIRITELAERDMENIGDYIADILLNPTAAVNTVQGILGKIKSLGRYPERNCLDDDILLADKGIRAAYYKDYKIFYTISDVNVYIIRVLHTRTDSKERLHTLLKNKTGN